MSKTTVQVRLYPTPEQSCLLMAHCQEYISTVNVLVAAFESDVLDGQNEYQRFQGMPAKCRQKSSLARCTIRLQAFVCAWLYSSSSKSRFVNGTIRTGVVEQGILIVPLCLDGKTQQVRIRCADCSLPGKAGTLRLKKKRGKWIADIALTLPEADTNRWASHHGH